MKMNMPVRVVDVNPSWAEACVNNECTLHQVSPYIGKIKSTIATDLISQYSSPGDLIVDPFAGSFTIPLEAALLGRRAVGADVSAYAYVLGKAKLAPPKSLDMAIRRAHKLLDLADKRPRPDLRKVPVWVRDFFHKETLREAIKLADLFIEKKEFFFLACLLGILHHQRPGFLSYPSSHLVPYLRDKKFPRVDFPEMYEYRDVKSRLINKISRAYKRVPEISMTNTKAYQKDIDSFVFPKNINCIITSPPYMNALDYGRDNRLRLWLINRTDVFTVDQAGSQKKDGFSRLMKTLGERAAENLVRGGYCVVIVGEQSARSYKGSPAAEVIDIFKLVAPTLRLIQTTIDVIPDIRRARRDCRGVRVEHFLVFEKK